MNTYQICVISHTNTLQRKHVNNCYYSITLINTSNRKKQVSFTIWDSNSRYFDIKEALQSDKIINRLGKKYIPTSVLSFTGEIQTKSLKL
jgi:hypothetical protein